MIKKKKRITPKSFTKTVKKPKKRSIIGPLTVLILGIALIPGSLLMSSFIEGKIDEGIHEQTVIPTASSSNYEHFKSNEYTGAPKEYKSFYLWNLTNPSEYLSGNAKPIFEEVGPFKFRNYKYKYDVSYSEDNSKVTYREYDKFVQVAGEDVSEVEITNFNPAMMGGIQVAGGTERKYAEFNLPFVLSQVKDTFKTIYQESMNETLSNTTWIEQTQREILSQSKTHVLNGFLDDDDFLYNLRKWLGINKTVEQLLVDDLLDMTVPNTFFDCIEVSTLQTFLAEGMPDWEEVFYAEWANDSFPAFDGNYSYLANHIDYKPENELFETLLEQPIEDLMYQTIMDEDLQKYQNALITKISSELVDASGSESGVGVDIDGTLIGEPMGSQADLNITNTVFEPNGKWNSLEEDDKFWQALEIHLDLGKIWVPFYGWVDIDIDLEIDRATGAEMILDRYETKGKTGITIAQSKALWNKSDPLSLTGFCNPTTSNRIWIDALENDEDARNTLMDHFNLESDQLDKVLEWIDTSLSTWVPNALVYQLNEWNSGPITTRTVEEWLFEGKDKAVHERFAYHNEDTSISQVNLFDNCQNQTEAENTYLEHKMYTIRTGQKNPSKARQIVGYGGQSTVNLWKTPEDIHGSLGMYNPPGTNKENPPEIFNPDLMRTIKLDYVGTTSIYGVKLNRFTFAPNMFSANDNYYMNTNGLINGQPIERFRGMPVCISKPHFLDAAQRVKNDVIGINPTEVKHETFIDVEPISGVTMNAQQRVQVNFNVSSGNYFTEADTTIMPIIWYERSGKVPEELAARFTDEVYPAQLAQGGILTAGMTCGIALTFAGGYKSVNSQVKRSKIKKVIAPKSREAFKKNINSVQRKLGYVLNDKKKGFK